MSEQDDPNVPAPSKRVAAELGKSQARSRETASILTQLEEAIRPVREAGERNHIAWKMKQAIGPRLGGGAQ